MAGLIFLSLFIQILAIGLAMRLVRASRREIGWAFVTFALVLMGVRRVAILYAIFSSAQEPTIDLVPELIALSVSASFVVGMFLIGPYLRTARESGVALTAKEDRLQALIEAVPDLLFVFSPDGVFREVVSKSPQGLELPREHYLGRSLGDFLTEEQFAHFVRSLHAAIRDRVMQVVEYEVTYMGVTRSWESRQVALNDHEVLVMGRNISDRKRAEESRLRLESKLQQSQKMESLGVLAGGIAHDFNNLLTGVLGNASLAIMNTPANSPAQPCLKQIEIAAQRAGDLTKQLLAYAGKGRFVIQSLSLSSIVEEMADLLKTVISKKAILKLDFDPDLPPIRADATQVRQIVMNLITNASDAIGERSGVIRLHTGVMFAEQSYLHSTYIEGDLRDGYYVYLEVTDSGNGMSDSVMRKIFDPFFTTKFTGRGLGLAAVLGIVRGHKGAIKVSSEPHKGTTFKVLFPVAAKGDVANLSATPLPDDWRGSGLILVVDDEDTVRAVTKSTLESVGFQVTLARHGEEAVDLFRKHGDEIRCVMLDLTMPRMGGEDTFRELRLLRPNVRVVLMSGYSEHDITNQFAGKGLAGFIQKPFRANDLLAMVRKTIEAK